MHSPVIAHGEDKHVQVRFRAIIAACLGAKQYDAHNLIGVFFLPARNKRIQRRAHILGEMF